MEKADIIRIVSKAAKVYDTNFKTKRTLVIDGALNSPSYMEIKASPENFLHLTGLKVNKSHILRNITNKNQNPFEVFYEKALHNRLVADDFDIKDESTEEKLSVLVNALDITSDLRKIGSLNKLHRDLKTDILIGNGGACLGFIKADEKCYIPNTVLKSSINEETCGKFTSVRAILNKGIAEKEYNNIAIADKKIDLSRLLEKLKDDVKISPNLITQVSLLANTEENKVNETLRILKNYRQTIIKAKNKSQKSQARKEHETLLDSFKDHVKFPPETLCKIVNELEKRAETAKEAAKAILKDDIDFINKEIQTIEELEKMSSTQSKIKSPTNALSSATSTLANNFNNNSNNTQNFAIEPPRRQQYNITPPVLVGQAAGAIATALPLPTNPPPLFDMDKIINALENLNEKIVDTIHNFADTFKRSREQPLQDRTARGRKINLSLPFPKEKPSQERTEPVTAKFEKAQKLDFKPAEHAEKKLSWIAKEISSAKREANENNKNHEPKHHDKDQSL